MGGHYESAGKRKSGRIRRGNAWVRRLLCEFAQDAARTRCALKAKFESLAIRKGHKKSIVALAHKMLRTIFATLRTGTHYQDKIVDYEAQSVARGTQYALMAQTVAGIVVDSITEPVIPAIALNMMKMLTARTEAFSFCARADYDFPQSQPKGR